MYAVKRRVFTCDGYDESWLEDGRLTVLYYGQHYYDVCFDGEWHVFPEADPDTARYLISSAVFSDAPERCDAHGLPLRFVPELISDDAPELISAELLRILLDDRGLSMQDALSILLRCFGEKLPYREDADRLYRIQPRAAHLELILREKLSSLALHDPYSLRYRSPFGAVKTGESVTLRVFSFGESNITAQIYGDDLSLELPMTLRDGLYTCEYTPDTPAALRYRFRVGDRWLCADESGAFPRLLDEPEEGFRLTVYRSDFTTPDWFARGIMYQIFPDRFGFERDAALFAGFEYHRALGRDPEYHADITEPVRWQPRDGKSDYAPEDFYGGNLRGIRKKLPYLKELGISVIYLNPVVEARSNHRYDTADYSHPDPILGSTEDYAALCREAEALGISVINDGVFSHTGADSIYFDRFGSYGGIGAYQNRGSEYYKWYDFRDYPDDYRSWWGFRDLPEVEETDKGWQELIVSGDGSIVRRWLRLGARGWRLDVADELPDEVLSLIRDAAKAEKPDCVIIGEVWEDAVLKESYGKRRNYALGYSLDSVMNYPFRSAVISFALGRTSAFELRVFLISQQANYPAPMHRCLMNLLGSHDVERLHTALSFDFDVKSLDRAAQHELSPTPEQSQRATRLQMLCAAIQYCVRGVPCLYYGDEECLDGGGDPFNRAPFEPTGGGLHDRYALLGRLRGSVPELIDGDMSVGALSPDVLTVTRSIGSGRVVCVINRSDTALRLPFSVLEAFYGDPVELSPMSAGIYRI